MPGHDALKRFIVASSLRPGIALARVYDFVQRTIAARVAAGASVLDLANEKPNYD